MDEARDQAVELEAAVVAPSEAGEVAPGMLGADPAIGADDRRLDVAERGVDPLERRPARRPLAAAGGHRRVLQAGLGRGGPAAQPVGDQAAGRGQVLGDEPLDLPLPEALDRQELDLARPTLVAGRDRGDEGLLAGRASAPFAGPVAAQIGVVPLDPAVEALGALAPGHHGHDLLLQRPGVGLLDAEPAPELMPFLAVA